MAKMAAISCFVNVNLFTFSPKDRRKYDGLSAKTTQHRSPIENDIDGRNRRNIILQSLEWNQVSAKTTKTNRRRLLGNGIGRRKQRNTKTAPFISENVGDLLFRRCTEICLRYVR